MNIQQQITEIRNGKIESIYLLLGTEQFLIDLFKKELKKEVIKDTEDEFNFMSFDMNESSLFQALEEAESIPFFGDYRMVAIDHPYFLTAEKKSNGPEHDINQLLRYLEAPSPSTVLLFIAKYEKLDERKKIVKLLKKKATIIDVSEMKENEVKTYVRQYISNEGYDITPEAFSLLLRLTDMNVTKAMAELQKLFLFSFETKKIIVSTVESLVPKSLEHNIFDMVKYVMQGQADKSIALYKDLLLQGEETIKINAILVSQFRLFLQVKIMKEKGYQQSNIVDVLKIHPYRVKLALQEVNHFSTEHLMSVYDKLVENEFKMKTGKMDKELLFELFLLEYGGK